MHVCVCVCVCVWLARAGVCKIISRLCRRLDGATYSGGRSNHAQIMQEHQAQTGIPPTPRGVGGAASGHGTHAHGYNPASLHGPSISNPNPRHPRQERRDELSAALAALAARIEALREQLAAAERDRDETLAAEEAARSQEAEGEWWGAYERGQRSVGRACG